MLCGASAKSPAKTLTAWQREATSGWRIHCNTWLMRLGTIVTQHGWQESTPGEKTKCV